MWDNENKSVTHTAHLHVCMTNARLGTRAGAHKAHTILRLDSDWFFFYNPFSASQHLTKSPLFIFIIRGDPTMYECREHVSDWLYHREISFTLYSLVDAPALNHQHATPLSLFLSHPLQTSRMPLALICTEELYFVASISILPSLTSVRFHTSSQLSALVNAVLKGY